MDETQTPQPSMPPEDPAGKFSDASFWSKLLRHAAAAGRSLIRTALLLYYTMRDPNTPLTVKAAIAIALLYFICPIDAIADVIPIVGYSDDAIVLASTLAAVSLYVSPDTREKAERKLERFFGPETE